MLKFEKDTTLTDGFIEYETPRSDYSFGFDYSINKNFVIGFSYERGNYKSLRFIYKNNPKTSYKKYEYQKAANNKQDDNYSKLISNLEKMGSG